MSEEIAVRFIASQVRYVSGTSIVSDRPINFEAFPFTAAYPSIHGLWNTAVMTAGMKMAGARAIRDAYTVDAIVPNRRDAIWEMHKAARIAYAVMVPFREAIAIRTLKEEDTARHRVSKCSARFLLTACSGETCHDCDMPLWVHVQTQLARYCPDAGRPYWQLVRAIFRSQGLNDPQVRTAVRCIIEGAR